MTADRSHPMQPIDPPVGRPQADLTQDGRFRPNAIVVYLLSQCETHPLESGHDFSVEDKEQLAQLMGYSLRGYAELSYVREESYLAALRAAEGVPDPELRAHRELLQTAKGHIRAAASALFNVSEEDLR